MSGRIDAGIRLLNVAEQSLGALRGNVDRFETIATTEKDQALREARGGQVLETGVRNATHGVAALAAARTSMADSDAAAASLAELDDTRTGVEELRSNFATMLVPKEERGTAKFDPAGVRRQIEQMRERVAGLREQLVTSSDGTAEVAGADEFERIAADSKRAKPLDVTDADVDEVVGRAVGTESTAGSMKTLESVSTDMVAAARAGKFDNLVGREAEVNNVLTTLQRKRKANPVLLGDAGVGKTQIVEGLALRVARGEVPESMRDLRIYSLDASTLKAAAGSGVGDMEKLVKSIIDEVSAQRKAGHKVVLFMDEMHTLMGAGDAAQQLKPALARGDVSIIGATTWDEFKKFIAKDAALVRRIAPVSVDELSKPQVIDVLQSVQEGLSRHHGVLAYQSAIEEAERLSSRFVKDRKQPDPAIELLDHALSRVSQSWNSESNPELEALTNEASRLRQNVGGLNRQVVIGDPRAAARLTMVKARLAEIDPKISSLTEQLSEERTTLTERNHVVSRYLALKDAGDEVTADALLPDIAAQNLAVHKLRLKYPDRLLTDVVDETAMREAASELYGRKISSGGAEDAKRLLGLGDTLAGKVIGQRTATDKVAAAMQRAGAGLKRQNAPKAVFLFSGPTGVGKTQTVRVATAQTTGDEKNMIRMDMGEFSEAHSVSKLFGSPPGYVGYEDTPALGALIKNPEAHVLFDEVEKAHPSIWQKLLALLDEGRVTMGDGRVVDGTEATFYMTTNMSKDQIGKFFSPEFRGRLTDEIEFGHLDQAAATRIVGETMLPETEALAKQQGIQLEVSDAAKERIARAGFSEQFGARPLLRSIEQNVLDPVSQLVLQLRAAGHLLDSASPQKAMLDVDPHGTGFIVRSEDGSIEIPVAARGAAVSHTPDAAGTVGADVSDPEWSLGNDAGVAVQPPADPIVSTKGN